MGGIDETRNQCKSGQQTPEAEAEAVEGFEQPEGLPAVLRHAHHEPGWVVVEPGGVGGAQKQARALDRDGILTRTCNCISFLFEFEVEPNLIIYCGNENSWASVDISR